MTTLVIIGLSLWVLVERLLRSGVYDLLYSERLARWRGEEMTKDFRRLALSQTSGLDELKRRLHEANQLIERYGQERVDRGNELAQAGADRAWVAELYSRTNGLPKFGSAFTMGSRFVFSRADYTQPTQSELAAKLKWWALLWSKTVGGVTPYSPLLAKRFLFVEISELPPNLRAKKGKRRASKTA